MARGNIGLMKEREWIGDTTAVGHVPTRDLTFPLSMLLGLPRLGPQFGHLVQTTAHNTVAREL